MKTTYSTLHTVLVIALVVALAYSTSITWSLANPGQAQADTPVDVKPVEQPKVQLIILSAESCAECADLSTAGNALTSTGVNVTEQQVIDGMSDAGKKLTAQYTITRLPALVLLGSIDTLANLQLRKSDDALILDAQAPYLDVASNAIIGRVTAIELEDTLCGQCMNASQIVTQLKALGVAISTRTSVQADSAEGQQLIRAYNITILPTIILSSDALEYSAVSDNWAQLGSKEQDDRLVLRNLPPPYHNLSSGKVEGLVTMTSLVDSSCADCYNPSLHEQILTSNFRMAFAGKKTVDVASVEGQSLLARYNLTKVPTIILSSDAQLYPGMSQVWNQVGTVESDGTFVFRNVQLLEGSVYKDLATGQVVNATGK